MCAECRCWSYMDRSKSRQVQRKLPVACENCGKGQGLRPRVMLYDDDEGDVITPIDLWEIMKVIWRRARAPLCVGGGSAPFCAS